MNSADAAELAFYEAFASTDIDAMADLWAKGDDVLCIHPAGTPISGHAAVMASWRDILGAAPPLDLEFERVARIETEDLVVSTVYEHFRPPGTTLPSPPVVATNVFRRVEDGWKMVVHHASPVDTRAQRVPPPTSTRH